MQYILKAVFIIYLLIKMIEKGSVSYNEILVLLLLISVSMLREKYFNSKYLIYILLILTVLGCKFSNIFVILFPLLAYDFILQKAFYELIIVLGGIVFYSNNENIYINLLIFAICIFASFHIKRSIDKEEAFIMNIDRERNLRYELERSKIMLLNSNREIEYLTEVKERNRIAREIHDNIGHSLAGILISLRATLKIFEIDTNKSKTMLKTSIDELSNSVTILRETVHNIKPKENIGIDYIDKIISNFKYCPVELKTTGNLLELSPNIFEVFVSIVKESLTNISKYSKASKVDILIDTNASFARLMIKDNGVGCSQIKEGLGLSGMKERVANIGGEISISHQDGFMIVCFVKRT